MTSSTCPKCRRPFNEGNSPNAEECNGPDDDEGLCEAYAKVYELRVALYNLLHSSVDGGMATSEAIERAKELTS